MRPVANEIHVATMLPDVLGNGRLQPRPPSPKAMTKLSVVGLTNELTSARVRVAARSALPTSAPLRS